jgi:predicted  nucleic acid-binding Zn-ribbon protein
MTVSATELRELHRIHRQLTDLRDRISRGPRQVQACESNHKKAELELEQVRDATKRARIAVDEKQLQLRDREGRITGLQGKLNAAASNREYQALKEQIAADEQANSVLEDEILEGLERIDELNTKTKEAEARLARAREELQKVKTRVEQEQGQLEVELGRLQAELKRAEACLPAEFKGEYDRIAKARGEQALAQVDGEVCGNCYQTLTSQMMNLLYLSQPVFCKSCGALLYLPEDRAPR